MNGLRSNQHILPCNYARRKYLNSLTFTKVRCGLILKADLVTKTGQVNYKPRSYAIPLHMQLSLPL